MKTQKMEMLLLIMTKRRRFFYLCGGIRNDGNSSLFCGKTDGASGMPHENRRDGAFVEGVELLKHKNVRMKRSDNIGDSVVDFLDASREGLGRAAHNASLHKFSASG